MKLPTSKRLRRLVVAFASTCLVVVALAQYFVVPSLFGRKRPDGYALTDGLLRDLGATLLAALIAALFVLWFYPDSPRCSSPPS